MSPTSYQAALPRVIPSLLSATLIIIPYSNGFVKRVRKVFLQRKQRMKTRLPTFFPESQQPRQFTPLREGRRAIRPVLRCFPNFNSRPSARGDALALFAKAAAKQFQFTPLREGRLAILLTPSAPRNFNSRPSARGDDAFGVCPVWWCISIHAPPRGATCTDAKNPGKARISIHAPPRGATMP